MSLFRGRTALITGASSGIGLELARLLLCEGSKLVLVSSDATKLGKAAAELAGSDPGGILLTLAKDLSQPQACQQVFAELNSRKIDVDILVNNAGFGVYGHFHQAELSKNIKMIDLNVRALAELTGLLAPAMIKRGFGRILNVASTAAFQAIPGEAAYAASKAFVLLFSEAIAEELKQTPVRVTCLCPGPTDTPFFERGAFSDSFMVRSTKMSPRQVAVCGLNALKKGRPLVIAGLSNRIGAFAGRVFPRNWVTRVAGKVVK